MSRRPTGAAFAAGDDDPDVRSVYEDVLDALGELLADGLDLEELFETAARQLRVVPKPDFGGVAGPARRLAQALELLELRRDVVVACASLGVTELEPTSGTRYGSAGTGAVTGG